jgi:itaconate CoA-transferase
MLPLEGVTVVSLEQAVAAPFATRQLADLGARVIKVERPDVGDFARAYDETVFGLSSYFVWLNRSKESLTLDVKTESGRAILRRLLSTADVFVSNLGPGATERLGLDPGTLAADFPDLITCTISGYGTEGPWADRKAYDLLVQAEAGLLSVTGTSEEIAKCGISVADIAAGMYAFSGVLTSLFVRATTGVVRAVEVSLFDALAEWMATPALYTKYSGRQPSRVGAQHATIAPYGPFVTGDGDELVIAIQNEREWAAFCDLVMDDRGLTLDPRFISNTARVAHRQELNALVSQRFQTMSSDVVQKALDSAHVATGAVRSMAEFLEHPALRDRLRWQDVGSPGGVVEVLIPPTGLAGVVPRMDPVPALGAHTDAILAGLGFTAEEADELRSNGVV